MLNKEDKADVKGAMGKAMANKVEKVTRDKSATPAQKAMHKEYKKEGTTGFGFHSSAKHLDVNPNPRFKHEYSPAEKSRLAEHAKSKALAKKSYSGHYQENASGAVRSLSQKSAERKGMGTYK